MNVFDFCSKFDATTSGSVAWKYLVLAFVKLEARPLFLSFSRMSYAVTRFIFACFAILETTWDPDSSSARYMRASFSVRPRLVRIGISSFGIL